MFSGPCQPISAQCCVTDKNQSFDLQGKPKDWFQYQIQHLAEMGKNNNRCLFHLRTHLNNYFFGKPGLVLVFFRIGPGISRLWLKM